MYLMKLFLDHFTRRIIASIKYLTKYIYKAHTELTEYVHTVCFDKTRCMYPNIQFIS